MVVIYCSHDGNIWPTHSREWQSKFTGKISLNALLNIEI